MGRVLITGGAGFIGGHLAAELLGAGWEVRVLDSLVAQVHGEEGRRPAYLARDVELIVGDVRDPEAVRHALDGVDAVVHLAALVGVGQSMYRMAEYTSVNSLGTAMLLGQMVRRPGPRLIVASSMSVYGEGAYRDADDGLVVDADRTRAQLEAGQWEPRGPSGEALRPEPTTEAKPPSLASIYALTKYDQERACLLTGRAYGFPATALRLFNVYGVNQALSNPYTGVLAIFAARLLNGRPPIVFEDGRQRRDFVGVRDVARAFRLALEAPVDRDPRKSIDGRAINIASGRSISILDLAERIAEAVGRPHVVPVVSGRFRAGDIRHCFADITAARELLGFEPRVSITAGLRELADWLDGQTAVDRVDEARLELESRGLSL